MTEGGEYTVEVDAFDLANNVSERGSVRFTAEAENLIYTLPEPVELDGTEGGITLDQDVLDASTDLDELTVTAQFVGPTSLGSVISFSQSDATANHFHIYANGVTLGYEMRGEWGNYNAAVSCLEPGSGNAIAFVAGVICLLYPRLTYFGLGELAVGVTFAPLLFMGTYFVMCGEFSLVPVLVSVSTGLLTVVLLHVHTLMDYDFDIRENKKTLCAILGSKMKSFYALVIMLILAYANILWLILFHFLPAKFLITFLTLPMGIGLVLLMKKFVEGDTSLLSKKWWMGPIEQWKDIEKKNAQNFMIRFYLARNLMGAFSFLVCVAILI